MAAWNRALLLECGIHSILNNTTLVFEIGLIIMVDHREWTMRLVRAVPLTMHNYKVYQPIQKLCW